QHDTEQQGGRRQCGTGRDPFEKSHLIIPLTQTVVLSPNSFGLRRATSSCKSYFLRSSSIGGGKNGYFGYVPSSARIRPPGYMPGRASAQRTVCAWPSR